MTPLTFQIRLLNLDHRHSVLKNKHERHNPNA